MTEAEAHGAASPFIRLANDMIAVEKKPVPDGHWQTRACEKWRWTRAQHRVRVWRTDDGDVTADLTSATDVAPTQRCWQTAQERAIALIPYGGKILAQAKLTKSAVWNDLEAGPARWLECTATGDVALASVATLLHELNHAASREKCLYEGSADTHVCFDLAATLPLRSLARVAPSDMGLDDSQQLIAAAVDATYMKGNEPFLLLLDELFAHRVSADAYTAIMRQQASGANAPSTRSTDTLAQLSFYTVHYIVELRRHDRPLYDRHFGPTTSNRAKLLDVLALCEQSYAAWAAEVARSPVPRLDVETRMWELYEAEKVRWLESDGA